MILQTRNGKQYELLKFKKPGKLAAIMFKGRQMTCNEIWHAYGRARGIGYQTIRKRMEAGDSEARLLRPPQVSQERREALEGGRLSIKRHQRNALDEG